MHDRLRSSIPIVLAVTSIGLVFVVACSSDPAATGSKGKSSSGGDDDDDDDDDAGRTSSSGGSVSSTAYTTELCARIERCSPGVVAGEWGDAKTCATLFEKRLAPEKGAANSGLTSAALSACAAKLKTASCEMDVDDIAECQFKGTAAANAGCALGSQCATGSCVFADDTSDCGKCAAPAAAGGDCATANCGPGLFCNEQNKCAAALAAGGDCTQGPCADSLRCVAGKCAAAVAKDGTCTPPASEDDDDPCVVGVLCIDGTCKAPPAPTAKAGEPCSETITCINSACNGTKCVAFIAEGGACTTSQDGPYCQSPMRCVSGKCSFDNTVPVCK